MDRDNPSSPPLIGSSTKSHSSGAATNQTCSAMYAAERARLMFGCYRRSEAADADTYTAAVAMILSHYSAEVVQAITDPFSGLPSRKTESGYSGLPDVADVKAACEAEATRLERLAAYAKLGKTQRLLPGPPTPPKATIFTAKGFPNYDKLVKRFEDGGAPAHFENHVCVDQVERYGIWTPYSWLAEASPKPKGFTQYTAADLLDRYQPKQPEAAE